MSEFTRVKINSLRRRPRGTGAPLSEESKAFLATLGTGEALRIVPNGRRAQSIRAKLHGLAQRRKLIGRSRIIDGVVYAWVERVQ